MFKNLVNRLSIRFEIINKSFQTRSKICHVMKSNSRLIYAYQQRIESLNVAAVILRSDVAFATVKLTQFLQISHSNHLSAADRVIFYLYEIRNLAIENFNKRSTNILLCVNNTTLADDEAIRKSFDEYLFQL
jgi:hypothetical protein